MNNRRKLVMALGASTLTAPFSSIAQQQGKVWRIGFLWERGQGDSTSAQYFNAFKSGMLALGYVEGKDFTTVHLHAQTDLTRFPAMVAELLASKVDMIVTASTPAATAAHKATREIPILITAVGDPLGTGLAESLRHPGGNVTGITNLNSELYAKRLDMLGQLLPGIRRVGFLYNPANASNVEGLSQIEAACAKRGLKSVAAPVAKSAGLEDAFRLLQREKVQGMIVSPAGTFIAWRESIIGFATKYRIPAVYSLNIFAESGGLFSYAVNNEDNFRRVATHADKIFKGAKPGDLPIEQPTKFETIINMKTAKALGIKIPDVVMLRAEKVIE